MNEAKGTKEQLLRELKELRKRITGLEKSDVERKRAEEALTQSEARFKIIFDNSMDAIGVSKSGVHVFVNTAYLSLYGYGGNQELAGRPILDLIAPAERNRIREYVKRRAAGFVAPSTYETRGLRKDGSEFDMDVHSTTYALSGDVYTLVIIRDITERKRAQDELKAAHGKLEATLRAVPDLMFETDREGRIYDYHAPVHEAPYVGPEVFLGKTVAEVLPENAANVIVKAVAEADEHGWHRGATYSLDTHGERQYFELSIGVMEKTGTSQKRFVAMARNITKRKQAEEALKKSEKQYRDLVDNSPVGIYTTNIEGKILFVNEALARMAGYGSPADMMKEGVLKTYKRGSDRDVLLKTLRETGKVNNFEFDLLRKDGKTLRVILNAVLEGATLSGMILDITERKQAEEERERLILELQEALAKIKTLSGMLPICSSCKKIRNDSGYWQQLEEYICDHSEAEFTHGICPDCMKRLYGEYGK